MAEDYKRARQLYERGRYAEAMPIYLQLAETTQDPQVYAFIGKMHLRGQGVPPDAMEAMRWYAKAADGGDVKAMLYLAGVQSSHGKYGEAREWLETAAARGYPPAFFFLGRMYDLGKGVLRDGEKGRKYIELAAERGYIWAQKDIALRMLKGQYGVWSIFRGAIACVTLTTKFIKTSRNDPEDERIRV